MRSAPCRTIDAPAGAEGTSRRRGLPRDDGERSVIAGNILARQFTADAPNQKWVADFTYIWTAEGWLYVAAVIDLFSRRVPERLQALLVSPRDADFSARLANQRTRRADLEQEIMLVERQLSTAERRVTPEAVERLGEVILAKLRSDDSSVPPRLCASNYRKGRGRAGHDHDHWLDQAARIRRQGRYRTEGTHGALS